MKRNADQIFNKYCKLLYKISIIMLCSEEDAYDAVQESFLKYLNTKKDFNDESHERAWLTRVNINISTLNIEVCNYDGKMVERITLILERRDGQCSVEMLKK